MRSSRSMLSCAKVIAEMAVAEIIIKHMLEEQVRRVQAFFTF